MIQFVLSFVFFVSPVIFPRVTFVGPTPVFELQQNLIYPAEEGFCILNESAVDDIYAPCECNQIIEKVEYHIQKTNFASIECGAKIINSSKDMVDSKSAFDSGVDKYLLMPCNAVEKWVVVELCEEIILEELIMGNYEVFSSMIKNFSVFSSIAYPGNWINVGDFSAVNSRKPQSFILTPEWSKFINITFISFDGDKYYCPISEIKITGQKNC